MEDIYLYGCSLLVRYVEHLIPLIREYKNLTVANNHLLDEVVWPYFWLVQIWLLICFFSVQYDKRTQARVLGREQIRSMFFGPGSSDVA